MEVEEDSDVDGGRKKAKPKPFEFINMLIIPENQINEFIRNGFDVRLQARLSTNKDAGNACSTPLVTAAVNLSIVPLIRLLTVTTDPSDSLAVGTGSTKIRNATVSNDPDPEILGEDEWEGEPSGRMANPDGSKATQSI